jgi:addiction module RelB/DinJ family antitoxin
MISNTKLFRVRVPTERLMAAEEILGQLGMKAGDAFNMLLAQIELRKGLPFEVTTLPAPLLSSSEQATEWSEALGGY